MMVVVQQWQQEIDLIGQNPMSMDNSSMEKNSIQGPKKCIQSLCQINVVW